MNALLDQAVAILSISPLQGYRERIRDLEAQIHEAQEEIADYRTRRVAAPRDSVWKTTVDDFDAQIRQHQDEIATLGAQARLLVFQIRAAQQQSEHFAGGIGPEHLTQR